MGTLSQYMRARRVSKLNSLRLWAIYFKVRMLSTHRLLHRPRLFLCQYNCVDNWKKSLNRTEIHSLYDDSLVASVAKRKWIHFLKGQTSIPEARLYFGSLSSHLSSRKEMHLIEEVILIMTLIRSSKPIINFFFNFW